MKAQEEAQTFQELLAGQRWDDAIAMATAALTHNPKDPGLYTSLAAAQMGAGRAADALAAADNARLLAPTWEWSHRMRARALAALGRADEALAAAETADHLEEDKPRMLDALITQQMAHKRLAEAEATANELVRIDPDWAEAWNDRGAVLLRRKKFEQAESDFRTALSLAPHEAAYMNNIGLALHRRGRREEAIEWFGRAAVRDPSFAPARRNLFASTRFYLWGGSFLVLLTLALHAVDVGLRGGSNARFVLPVLLGFIGLVGASALVTYWVRRRSLDPIAKSLYAVEARRARYRVSAGKVVKAIGFLLLIAAIFVAVLANQIKVAVSIILVAVVLLRAWEMVRFVRRRLQR